MAAGLLGLFDLRFTIRLTQALNHHYRSRLFERIQALPMTTFDDERIGDAVFRVMYDTPAITNAVYRILLTPAAAGAFALAVVGTLRALSTATTRSLVGVRRSRCSRSRFLVTLPFAGAMRRRSTAARGAGASATTSLEEGLANMLAVQSLGGEARERCRFDRASWGSLPTPPRAGGCSAWLIFLRRVRARPLRSALRVFRYVAGPGDRRARSRAATSSCSSPTS